MVLVVKNPPANTGDIRDAGSVLELRTSPGKGHGNPLQYSCLENPHGQRVLTGHNVAESDMTERLSHNDDTSTISLPTPHRILLKQQQRQVFRVLAKENVMLIQSDFIFIGKKLHYQHI